MTLPLSKTLDPADFDQLREELAIVDRCFTDEREQHPMRRWEYALALRAYHQWGRRARVLLDVGGGGSPFYMMVPGKEVTIIDPEYGLSLAQYLTEPYERRLADAVFCLSVLEHVDDLDEFVYHLSCLVAPGGLLFLTMDYCDSAGAAPVDTYHFHWMRRRIFNFPSLIPLADSFLYRDCLCFGDHDFTAHGPQVYDYTFCSLALRKRL